jgi:predicted transcriptional regulator
MAKTVLREEARRLRSQGYSVKAIENQLGVARSSVSLWVRDIVLTEAQVITIRTSERYVKSKKHGAEANAAKHRALRKAYQQMGRLKACEGSPLHHAGCMLYWAEGEKSKNTVNFVNSDLNMMLLFVRFLRDEMQVADDKISIRIHCHTTDVDEIERIESFWTELLQLSASALRRRYIKQKGESTRRILEYGVCGVKVHSTELVQHIYGAIQEYGGFDNPAWLF